MRMSVICSLVAALAARAYSQKISLEDYIVTHRSNLSGEAPIICLEGEKLFSTGDSLAEFDRKAVTFGRLRTIVPTSMIQIDDSFTMAPDLYDGLDLRSKVLYFLSTLNVDQMKLAATRGIGFADIDGQQKAVLNSIIPQNFKVERRKSGPESSKTTEKLSLSAKQRLDVRLKITRSTSFTLHLTQDPRMTTQVDSMDLTGSQNQPGFARILGNQRSGADEIFGVRVRKTVPNKQKASDLNSRYQAFNETINISSRMTVVQVCEEVKRRSGVSIVPDIRVANRTVTVLGDNIRVGDLLPAMAMMVTGTYRKLGSDYVLTSDLTGLGTRKLRFDQWEADIRDYIRRMTPGWLRQIEKSQALAYAGFSASDTIQPNASFQEYLDKKTESQDFFAPLPAGLIDSNITELVDRFNAVYKTQQASTNDISAFPTLRFNFTMPTGEDILENGELSSFAEIVKQRNSQPEPARFAGKQNRKLASESNIALVFRPKDKASTKNLLTSASKFGAKEVWIETLSQSVLEYAVDQGKSLGIGVRFIFRPWRSSGQGDDLDRTLLGDTGKSLKKWYPQNARLAPQGSDSFLRGKLLAEDTVSADARPASWLQGRSLCSTPGLLGVVVLDVQTGGYEPIIGESMSLGASPSDLAPTQFGYSTSMRSAFLHAYGVDPIDLVPNNLRSQVNINPMFFQDIELMGFPRTYGSSAREEFQVNSLFTQWCDFRGSVLRASLKKLKAEVIGDLSIPVWSDLLSEKTNERKSDLSTMSYFSRLKDFQMSSSALQGPDVPAIRFTVDSQSDINLEGMMRVLSTLPARLPEKCLSLDLSRLSENEITNFLNKWFDPKQSHGS